jgi:anion-transporting  ArsA/GET3 family ATPase
MKPTIAELVRTRRVIVCGGSGGVGKTTTATAIAIAAAQEGRKVLALTVDPSKRLAQTLGVDRNVSAPVSVSPDRLALAGISPPGLLEAWMLDPQVVADSVVEKLAHNPEEAAKLKGNRIYRQLSKLVAGMQEYMAMEALYRFIDEGRYDLIVLDTPPSRNALDFLLGPGRMAAFLEGRVFQLFLPGEKQGFFRAAASSLITKINGAIFGEETYAEMQDFFGSFSGILMNINRNASAMLTKMQDPEQVAFLLVSSPAAEALTEAFFFRRKTMEMNLPFRGFILNRSEAFDDGRVMPTAALFGTDTLDPVRATALAKLVGLARLEHAQVERDRALLQQLRGEVGEQAFAVALPTLASGAHEMTALMQIADALMTSPV